MDSDIVIWGLTFLTGFCKWVHLLFKKWRVRLSKENLFCSNNAPEIHTFNYWRHQKLLLVTNQLQENTFWFGIKSEDIGIIKIVQQLKLKFIWSYPFGPNYRGAG